MNILNGKNIWKFVNCNMYDDWNIGHRRCPGKMSSLGGPTLKKIKLTVHTSCYWGLWLTL